MPTENRSSNTVQMVSVPRDEVERLVKLLQYQAHPCQSPHAEFWQGLLDAPAVQHQGELVGWSSEKPTEPGAYWVRGNGLSRVALIEVVDEDGALLCNLHDLTTCDDFDCGFRLKNLDSGFEWCGPLHRHPPTSDGANPEQMAVQGADGYRNGIKAAAQLAADYPELAQAIRDLPLPQ